MDIAKRKPERDLGALGCNDGGVNAGETIRKRKLLTGRLGRFTDELDPLISTLHAPKPYEEM